MIDIDKIGTYNINNCVASPCFLCSEAIGTDNFLFEYIFAGGVPRLNKKEENSRFSMHIECFYDAGGSQLKNCGHVLNYISVRECYGIAARGVYYTYCLPCYEEQFGPDFMFDKKDLYTSIYKDIKK